MTEIREYFAEKFSENKKSMNFIGKYKLFVANHTIIKRLNDKFI